jgi:hypothetical protein
MENSNTSLETRLYPIRKLCNAYDSNRLTTLQKIQNAFYKIEGEVVKLAGSKKPQDREIYSLSCGFSVSLC